MAPKQRGEDLDPVAQHFDLVALGGGHAEHPFERPTNSSVGTVLRGHAVRGRCHAVRSVDHSGAGAASGSDSATLCAILGRRRAGANSLQLCGDGCAEEHRDRGQQRPQQQRDHPREWTVGLSERRAVGEEQAEPERDDAPQADGDRRAEGQPRPRGLRRRGQSRNSNAIPASVRPNPTGHVAMSHDRRQG